MKASIETLKQNTGILFKALRELIDPPAGLLDPKFIEDLSFSTRYSTRELNQVGNRLVVLYQVEKSEAQEILKAATEHAPNQHMDLEETAKIVWLAMKGHKRSIKIIERWGRHKK